MQWHIIRISNKRQFRNIHTHAHTHTYTSQSITYRYFIHTTTNLFQLTDTTSPNGLSHVKGKAESKDVIKGYTDHVIPPPNWISTEDEPGWTARMRPLGSSLYRAHGELEVVVNIITNLLLYYYFVTILPIRTRSKYNFVVTLIKMS